MNCTAIQSDKATDKVAKLCYAVRGPFQIVCSTGRSSYIVRKLNKLNSPEFKFMSEDLYILPPTLKLYGVQTLVISINPMLRSSTRYKTVEY